MRKPEDKKRPRDRRETAWSYMREHDEWTLGDIEQVCDLHRTTIWLYVRNLMKAGIIEAAGKTSGNTERRYRLVQDSIEMPRVRNDGTIVTQGLGQKRMWTVIRHKRFFVLRDLTALTSDEIHTVSRAAAETYLRYLVKIEYVMAIDSEPMSRATYMIIKDTGPLHPEIQRVKQVWDPNLKEVVWPKKEDAR